MFKLGDFNMNEEAVYSISRPYESKQICDFINNSNSIIDGTAGVGGDSVNFAQKFNEVHAFEINYDTFNLLDKNITKFNIKNIKIYNDDFIKIFDEYKYLFDTVKIIYIDPQWGGQSYKSKQNIKLYISNIPIEDIIKMKNSISENIIIYMKCPFNIDTTNYDTHIIDRKNIYNKSNIKVFQILKLQ